ncbi:hypothetical protein [Flavobacterium sp.]|uniref:hypothetical protein n=1 Tax=Flavobacterium sp. TaxID=239 RepID=UPI003D6C4CE5
MFKNIQKQLLLKYPLLWNTRFIPMVCIGLLINLLYFFVGYADGTINFKERYDSDLDFTFFSFCFLISVIILILWLVNYFKNNSFKSFYPKSKNALFFEWIQILVIVILLSAFYFPFEYGRQLHKRNYIDEETARKRCETISKADFFIDAGFDDPEIDSTNSVFRDTVIDGTPVYTSTVYKDYVRIFGKKYSPTALINRNTEGFSFTSHEEDSLRVIAVRKLLAENKSQEVKKIMQDYLAIIKEHQLETNLTLDKWFEITYNYPEFSKYELISRNSPTDENPDIYTTDYSDYETAVVDTSAIAMEATARKYSKYFIERNTLFHNYSEVARAFTKSVFQQEALLVLFYMAFGLSLLILSFRVTSGKSWLIAVVGLGIMNIIFGIISAASSESLVYSILMILSIIVFFIYFININIRKSGKKYSMIVLNLILWLFGSLIPLCYLTYQELYLKSIRHLGDYYSDPYYQTLTFYAIDMLTINLIIVFISMFFFTRNIRHWKGISEE